MVWEPPNNGTRFTNEMLSNLKRNRKIATQSQTYQEPVLVTGNILDRYDIGKEIAIGGQGKIYHATERETGRAVVVKRYGNENGDRITDWDSILKAEQGAAREMGFLKLANAAGIEHVPLLYAVGVAPPFNDPVSVFAPIHGRSVRSIVVSPDYHPSKEEVAKALELAKKPLSWAHTFDIQPWVHRDIKPDNVILNGEGATLLDFGYSTPTSGKSILRTMVVSDGFSAPEVSGELNDPKKLKGFDGRADVFSLAQVMRYMLIGSERWQDCDARPSREDFQETNVSRGLIEVLEKATRELPEDRFQTAMEFYNASSRNLNGNVLPVLAKPKPQEVQQESHYGDMEDEIERRSSAQSSAVQSTVPPSTQAGLNPFRAVDNGNGTITIFGPNNQNNFNKKGTVYETVSNIINIVSGFPSKRSYLSEEQKIRISQIATAYFKLVAPEHPILQEVLAGNIVHDETHNPKRASLEGVLQEKGPSNFSIWLNKGAGEDFSPDTYENLKAKKEAHLARRKQVYEIFGANEKDFTFLNGGSPCGFGIGLVGLNVGIGFLFNALGYQISEPGVLSIIAANTIFGTTVGSKLKTYFATKKLSSQTRKMGSWIAEGRRAVGLEGKVGEEEIRLTDEENKAIDEKSKGVQIGTAITTTGLGALVGMAAFYSTPAGGIGAFGGAMLGIFSAAPFLPFLYTKSKHFLEQRKLREKRIAAGLDKDGMRDVYSGKTDNERGIIDEFRKILNNKKLKKIRFRSRFESEGVKVEYEEKWVPAGAGYSILDCIDYRVMAKPDEQSQAKAKEITEALKFLRIKDDTKDLQPEQSGPSFGHILSSPPVF
ncbi:MAG: hypothetical protein NTW17_00165 [Candidatus Pacearchaeota archaeon]|nr:hypothetical protein [Candidatus Pacearchaeota archaeon]